MQLIKKQYEKKMKKTYLYIIYIDKWIIFSRSIKLRLSNNFSKIKRRIIIKQIVPYRRYFDKFFRRNTAN